MAVWVLVDDEDDAKEDELVDECGKVGLPGHRPEMLLAVGMPPTHDAHGEKCRKRKIFGPKGCHFFGVEDQAMDWPSSQGKYAADYFVRFLYTGCVDKGH